MRAKGRRPKLQDARSVSSRVTVEVDQNVHPIRGDALSQLNITQLVCVDKGIERSRQTSPHWAAIVGSVGIRADLESRAVVRFEQARQEIGRRVIAKVAGK